MSTVQTIMDGAVEYALANDDGVTRLLNDVAKVAAYLDRKVKGIYTLAGRAKPQGPTSGHFFATSTTITLATAGVALPTDKAFILSYLTAAGAEVHPISRPALDRGIAELPPGIVVEQNTVLLAGRTGDPVDADVLTLRYTQLPATLTDAAGVIGAITSKTLSTSVWPDYVGDQLLIVLLAQHLAFKAADRPADELTYLADELQEAASAFAAVVGLTASRLVETDSRRGS